MNERELMGLIESLLFVSGDAVPIEKIAAFLDMDIRDAKKLLEELIDIFDFERRGIQIIKINDSYQLATRSEYGEYIEDFFGSDEKQTLSQAVLETLSIIAYRQPITRMDIEMVRGVKCAYAVNVLIGRKLIKEVGRMDTPGKPILYGTTDIFLKSFGLSSLEDLPPLKE